MAALEISRVGLRSHKAGLELLFYKTVSGILLSGLGPAVCQDRSGLGVAMWLNWFWLTWPSLPICKLSVNTFTIVEEAEMILAPLKTKQVTLRARAAKSQVQIPSCSSPDTSFHPCWRESRDAQQLLQLSKMTEQHASNSDITRMTH